MHSNFNALSWPRICGLLVLTLGLNASLWAAEKAQLNLPRVTLQAGLYKIDAQVAQTPAEQQLGLMYRQEMPEHEGMLFVFPQKHPYCFWMKNTALPLSIAFIDDQGVIVNTADMQAQSTEQHCAQKPVRYALEMNLGWFDKRRIQSGSQLRGPMWAAW